MSDTEFRKYYLNMFENMKDACPKGCSETVRFRRLSETIKTLSNEENPPAEQMMPKLIDVNGREEHEAILKDPKKCDELGLDIYFETMVYLKRWGGWLNE